MKDEIREKVEEMEHCSKRRREKLKAEIERFQKECEHIFVPGEVAGQALCDSCGITHTEVC